MSEKGVEAASKLTPRNLGVYLGWLLAAAFLALWLIARGEADDARADANAATAELAEVRDAEAAETAAAAAEAAERPDLAAIARRHGLGQVVERGSADSLSLTIRSSEVGEFNAQLGDLLEEVGFNRAAMLSRLGNTRALDGTQSDTAEHVEVTWTYHPDSGLNMVFEVID